MEEKSSTQNDQTGRFFKAYLPIDNVLRMLVSREIFYQQIVANLPQNATKIIFLKTYENRVLLKKTT